MPFPTLVRPVAGAADDSGTCPLAAQAGRGTRAAAPRNLRAGGTLEAEPFPPHCPP